MRLRHQPRVLLWDQGRFVLSPTDLSNFLACRHRTALDVHEALGRIRRPRRDDPHLEALMARGLEHERQYVASLRESGRQILDLGAVVEPGEAVARTRDAMRKGVDVIVQAALEDGCWYGRPDVLLRVSSDSRFGAWSYEPADTKLARETRAGAILQLGLYCELLAGVQGRRPERFFVVVPAADAPVREYRTVEYAAYFRLLQRHLEEAVAADSAGELPGEHYPEPVEHCDICHWWAACDTRRREDDHLSLVAGITRVQRRELQAHSITTVAGLANTPAPLEIGPRRGAVDSYERVREQARVQVQSRQSNALAHELILPIEPEKGLCRLPPPSPGDVFLDLEGDPFAGSNGREYLFGLVSLDASGEPRYVCRWAMTEAEEAAAFTATVDAIMAAWDAHPGMHVYHYAPYEPAALKRLMGRFAAREQEIDRLLRAGRFVDLYAVVRQGLRAGVERYSIKALEPLYGFARRMPLADASRALHTIEYALELGLDRLVTPDVRQGVEDYNRDDCLSALRLRDWLESQRAALEAAGHAVPRPEPAADEAPEHVTARQERVAALRERLLAGVPPDRAGRDEDQQARWMLAYLLDWHRREDKATWWEYFRLRDLAEEDLFDEPQAIAGLTFVERVEHVVGRNGRPTGSVVDRYRYPEQEMEIHRGDELRLRDEQRFGKVARVDRAARTIDVRKGPSVADMHPPAFFAFTYFRTDVIEDAIAAIGDAVAGSRPDPLAWRLLRADPPATTSGVFAAAPGESPGDFAVRTVLELERSVLAIQGPPGAGKTYTGARMICALVKAGKRVGVTATSHTVVRNLLDAVAAAGDACGDLSELSICHKIDAPLAGRGSVREIDDNAEARQALASGAVHVLGGTAWLWTRDEFIRSVDVLFVDEAGQMSLANALAVTRAADSLVLLGDPQQLEQPQRGTHPEGVGASVLQHMLGEHATMPADRGIFLPETWRLAPSIAAFTSEVFYEDRLRSKRGLERQVLTGGPFAGQGLWVIDIDHDGNRNASDEEADTVKALVERLVAPGSSWVDELGNAAPLTGADILVVAPFNAHVARVSERVAELGVRVGTVDRFQGQEAPVVIYSMATSRPEDAPRGLEFLYSLHRLNVATSRARCAAFLVANPRLFVPDCRTPRQMRLANALCRYRELARTVDPAALGIGQMGES